MRTYPLEQRVNSQVSFSKEVNKQISIKASELGVTRSRLVNAIVLDRLTSEGLAAEPAVKTRTVLRKAKK